MAATPPVVVIARWQVAPESVERVLALVDQVRHRTLEEPGCQGYDVFIGLDKQQVLLVERYADDSAVYTHRNSPHYRDIVQGQIVPLLTGRSVELLQPHNLP